MDINSFIKSVNDIIKNDVGVSDSVQRIEQTIWILFLKLYDILEEEWELIDLDFSSVIPEEFRWRNWAVDHMDGKALTSDALLSFVNDRLLPALKSIAVVRAMPFRKIAVKSVFEDLNNYMKDGILLRQIVNVIDRLKLDTEDARQDFTCIFEKILQSLQSEKSTGVFYSPRPITDFMARMTEPKIGDRIADFACGTGGFMISSLKLLGDQVKSSTDLRSLDRTFFGIEKKSFPYLLCMTNLFLHGIVDAEIWHDNSLSKNLRDYSSDELCDLILMNPTFAGNEKDSVRFNFPSSLRSTKTADLFLTLAMYRLKPNGRASVLVQDSFMYGTDKIKTAIKKRLVNEFNLHTVIRLPNSVFAPFSQTATNIIFFDRRGMTEAIWVYRLDMPQGARNFTAEKPLTSEHFRQIIDWWHRREEISVNGLHKARRVTREEIAASNFNLDVCGFSAYSEETYPSPRDLIRLQRDVMTERSGSLERKLAEIEAILEENA
ncbi:MAG: type I restriction-modification system subunit M [Deltaproteobacteria bacterium]|jgi:type I restriction enzyme M protein|nr:type I restriction-modification system subunit M [Deltaproteobacteria bacterium]